jgi:hypothetical protein
VHQQVIIDGINKYIADRILSEKETAASLKDLQETSTV